MKRIIAGILCATMLFSMDGYRNVSYAAGTDSYSIVEASSADSVLEAASSSTSNEDPNTQENNGDAASGGAATDASTPSSAGEESSQKTSDEAADDASEDKSTEGKSDASTDATSVDNENAAEEASSEASVDGEEADAAASASSEELNSEDSNKVLNSTYSLDEYDEDDDYYSECFRVDSNGVLQLKEGFKLNNDLTIPAKATTIPKGLFSDSRLIGTIDFQEGSKLTTIEEGAFENSSLKFITIPSGVTEIKDDTFRNARSLEWVEFENENIINSIGNNAFEKTRISSLHIPNATSIGMSAFYGCSQLESIACGKLVSIGNAAFSDCVNLGSMFFGSELKYIGSYAFDGCSQLSAITFEKSKEDIVLGEYCFQNSTSLRSVILPEKLATIPIGAFTGCSNLTSVTVKNGTTRVANNAFERCSSLSSIILPQVREFDEGAFVGCTSLKDVKINYEGEEKIVFADNVFPSNNKIVITLHGYKEEVQKYAAKKNLTFKSLATEYGVTVNIKGESAGFDIVPKKASKGTTVNIIIKPAKGNSVKDISISSKKENVNDVKLTEESASSKTFSFRMPEGDTSVDVSIVKNGQESRGNLKPEIMGNDCEITPNYNKEYKFDKSGMEASLTIIDSVDGKRPYWLWNYTSSNTKIATVSSDGIIRTVSKGSTVITATLKSNANKKLAIPIVVGDTISITGIKLILPGNDSDIDENLNNSSGELPTIQYMKYETDQQSKSINVSIETKGKKNPKDDKEKETYGLKVKSIWSSSDPKIATVASNSTDNENTVKILKGAVGEALITVSVLNEGQKTPSLENTKSFVVRIVDPTPRLDNGTLTVDSNSTVGTKLDIRTVYGAEIEGRRLVVFLDKGKTSCPNLEVRLRNGEYYLRNKNPKKPFTAVYSGTTQLYLKGSYINDGTVSGDFYIPIPKVTVTNAALNPALKVTGKINLFYNSTADSSIAGKVTVTQSLSNLKVQDDANRHVKLISVANYKKEDSEKNDSFASNFKVEKVDDKSFEITRTSNDMVKVGGKNVVSGYIAIPYEGYSGYIYRAITIPTCDTAPEYVLIDKETNLPSATASIYSKNQEYTLILVDKKTKKNIVDLSTLDTRLSDSKNIIGLGLDGDSTLKLFKRLDMPAVQEAKDKDRITLCVNGEPKNGVANIYVRMTTWSRPLTYKFTLTRVSNLPTVKLSSTNVILNKSYPKQAATIRLTQNQHDAKLDAGKIRYVGKNKKLADSADALLKSIEFTKDTIRVNIPEQTRDGVNDIAIGTYNFNVIPDVKYDGDEEPLPCKPIAFNVVVTQTNPTLKLNNPTFILNANAPGYEEYIRTYTIGNLPTGVTGTVDDSEVEYIPVGLGQEIDRLGMIKFDDGKAIAKLKNNNTVKSNAGKTFKYKVHGLKVRCTYKDENENDKTEESTIPDFVINLQLARTNPAIRVTASGTINPVDPASRITYKVAVSNIVSDIDGIEVWEKDDNNTFYPSENGDDSYGSKHFEIALDSADSKIAYIKVKDGEKLETNKKYNISLVYKLKAAPDTELNPVKFTIVPKQTLPAIVTDKTTATLYAGQKNRTISVRISKKAQPAINAELDKVSFADGTPDAVKKAFKDEEPTFDEKTGIMTLELVNPSALVQNKDYTINFVTHYKNQADGSVGNKFSVKVTLKK
ncbi:leucine-rich repeat protein [Butyrivibrio proteoclasticus]|uniref:leucine-rich repeat protein n=1 Tax=Butyrivibrio proteoclasticus TaxID=43305 RepID=UPI00068715D3|nr:leucine-rich repeat protein [Butyrivibrio proteoclasticus]